MASKDQQNRLQQLWDLTLGAAADETTAKTGKAQRVRDSINAITNAAQTEVTINGTRLSSNLQTAFLKANPEYLGSEEAKKISQLGGDLIEKWNTVIKSGTAEISKDDIYHASGSSNTNLRFIVLAGKSTGTKDSKSGGARNNFLRIKRINSELLGELFKSSKYKEIFGEGRDKTKGGKSLVDLGHGQKDEDKLSATKVQGKANVGLGVINDILGTLGEGQGNIKSVLEAGKKSITKLELKNVDDKRISYDAGFYRYTSTMYYDVDEQGANKSDGAGDEKTNAKELEDSIRDAWGGMTRDEFINQEGSRSPIDTVADMIINSKAMKRAYKTKGATNLTKHRSTKQSVGKRSTAQKNATKTNKNSAIALGLDPELKKFAKKGSRQKQGPEQGLGLSEAVIASTGMMKLLNQRISKEVMSNMGKPNLTIRTGRFAESVNIQSITPAARTLMVKYTYRINPYETFENKGSRRWPSGYNPKPLISKSIRGLAMEMFKISALTTRRV